MKSLRHSLALAAVAALAVLLWAAPAHAATVANSGPVTLSSGSAGDPNQVGGIDLVGASATGTVSPDGNLLFPAAGVTLPALPVPPSSTPTGLGTLEILGGEISLEPTHDVTGTIDPATGAVALLARGEATGQMTGTYAGSPFQVTCEIGSGVDPIELPLSTEPLGPSGYDVPVPYDQSTGTAELVGRASLPVVAASDCGISGGFVATLLGPFLGFFIDSFTGPYDDAPLVLAARFDPAPHAPGFTPPSLPGTPAPAVPILPSTTNLVQAPSNLFTVGAAALSSSKGSATLTLDLPGPGLVKAVATANLPAGAAKRITVAKLTRRAARAGRLKLTLKPSKAALRHLRRRGKLRTSVKLTYTPTGGSARSVTPKVTLKLKRKTR